LAGHSIAQARLLNFFLEQILEPIFEGITLN